jgi:hypothetical protein
VVVERLPKLEQLVVQVVVQLVDKTRAVVTEHRDKVMTVVLHHLLVPMADQVVAVLVQ